MYWYLGLLSYNYDTLRWLYTTLSAIQLCEIWPHHPNYGHQGYLSDIMYDYYYLPWFIDNEDRCWRVRFKWRSTLYFLQSQPCTRARRTICFDCNWYWRSRWQIIEYSHHFALWWPISDRSSSGMPFQHWYELYYLLSVVYFSVTLWTLLLFLVAVLYCWR